MSRMRDAKLVGRLDLPAEHKAYVSNIWYENPHHRSALQVLMVCLLNALVPAICAVLIGTLRYPPMQMIPLLRLTAFVVWGIIVCAPFVAVLGLLDFKRLAREPEKLRASLAKRECVEYAARRSTVGKMLVFFSIVLVVLLVMVGWTMTGVFYLLSWLVLLAIRVLMKEDVQEEIKNLYEQDRDRVRQARNVTPRPQII